jgi:hypothetical protein
VFAERTQVNNQIPMDTNMKITLLSHGPDDRYSGAPEKFPFSTGRNGAT